MTVSGLRRGEAAGLRWCDIDFAGTTLTVSRQLQETSRGLVLLPPKSIAGNRVLALDPWTVQVLASHRGRQQLPAGCDGYVFARPGGRPYPPGYLTRRFAMLVRREGLPPIRLHGDAGQALDAVDQLAYAAPDRRLRGAAQQPVIGSTPGVRITMRLMSCSRPGCNHPVRDRRALPHHGARI
jgi:integrase